MSEQNIILYRTFNFKVHVCYVLFAFILCVQMTVFLTTSSLLPEESSQRNSEIFVHVTYYNVLRLEGNWLQLYLYTASVIGMERVET